MDLFFLVRVDSKYCEYLRNFDDKVYYNSESKSTRPFVGVLFNINGIEYFAPLSSPKPKHLTMKSSIDFIKLDYGKLGVINLNNMIPVTKDNYKRIDLYNRPNNNEELKYHNMLIKQLNWLNSHIIQINKRSYKLYNLYINNKLPNNIKIRCCDFKLLEDKCNEYNGITV